MIRKDAIVRTSFIERLKQNRGTFEEKFYIKITQQLVEILADFLSNYIVTNVIKNWEFLERLYKISLNKPKKIVRNSLKHPKFCIGRLLSRVMIIKIY